MAPNNLVQQSIGPALRGGWLRGIALAFAGAVLIAVMVSLMGAGSRNDYNANYQRFMQMSPEDRIELKRKKERFEALSSVEQQRRRDLHADIIAHPNADRMLRVARQYQEWLRTLAAPERTELLALELDERIEKLKWYRSRFEEKIFGLAGTSTALPSIDLPALNQWVKTHVHRKYEELRSENRWLNRQVNARVNEPLRPWVFYIWYGDQNPEAQLVTRGEINQLSQELSPEARAIIDSRESDEEMTKLVEVWIRNAVLAKIRPPVTDERLKRFLNSLPPEERQQFDDLSPREWREQTERAYYQRYGFESLDDN